jgi:hypothetical protein
MKKRYVYVNLSFPLFKDHLTISCFISSSDSDILFGHKAELHIHVRFRKREVDGSQSLSQIQSFNQSMFVRGSVYHHRHSIPLQDSLLKREETSASE